MTEMQEDNKNGFPPQHHAPPQQMPPHGDYGASQGMDMHHAPSSVVNHHPSHAAMHHQAQAMHPSQQQQQHQHHYMPPMGMPQASHFEDAAVSYAGIPPPTVETIEATKPQAAAAGASVAKFKKAPDAPKRFKSAFIIFSAEKHKEIKENLALQGRAEKTTDIAKLVSEAWREMPPDEKEGWEKKARKDKARYEVEKAMYKGPWKIPANRRTPKDPTAPKRPMSAFLAFSNKRRAALKRQHPDASNADLSKMLSKTWREIDEEVRRKYMDEEAKLRAEYKVEMGKWRKKVAEEKKAERKEREAMALQAAEARQVDGGADMSGATNTDTSGGMGAASSGGDPNGSHASGNASGVASRPGESNGGAHASAQSGSGGGSAENATPSDVPSAPGFGGAPGPGMYGNPYGFNPYGFPGDNGMPGGAGAAGFMGFMPPGANSLAAQAALINSGAAAQQQLLYQIHMNQQLAQRNAMGLYGQGLMGPGLQPGMCGGSAPVQSGNQGSGSGSGENGESKQGDAANSDQQGETGSGGQGADGAKQEGSGSAASSAPGQNGSEHGQAGGYGPGGPMGGYGMGQAFFGPGGFGQGFGGGFGQGFGVPGFGMGDMASQRAMFEAAQGGQGSLAGYGSAGGFGTTMGENNGGGGGGSGNSTGAEQNYDSGATSNDNAAPEEKETGENSEQNDGAPRTEQDEGMDDSAGSGVGMTRSV